VNLASLDFVNSDWRDWRGTGRTEDRLLNPRWREDFLRQWNLGRQGVPDNSELSDLRALRTLLREIIQEIVAQNRPAGQELSSLNAYLKRVPLYRQVSCLDGKAAITLVPLKRGWDWVMASIAASFVDLLQEDPRRLKICANLDCSWVFYDESRNRTRRWCDGGICGNLVKVRQFRARNRDRHGPQA